MSDVAEPDLPGVYMLEVVELAARWHVAAGDLLRGLPISVAELRDPGCRVPILLCAEVVERARRLTREPALALYMGMQMRLSWHGFLGFAAMTAGTLREALELAVRFCSTRTTAIGLALYVEGATASFVIEERAPLGGLREYAILSLMVGLWRIGEGLLGRPPEGVAECAFPEPEDVRTVPLGGMIRFARPANRLLFSAALLDTPLEGADPVALKLARAQCERELAAVIDAGLAGRVRDALLAQDSGFPGAVEVARHLHLSTRTLKRRLAEKRTSFSAILDDVRRQRAMLLLDNRELSIAEVAARVGYTEVPNFTRAFRKWTGTTPSFYRGRTRT